MATSRSTISALFGTVTTAANTVTRSLASVDTAVGMASTAIEDAARRQKARSKLDEKSYKVVIATEKAMELELQKESVIDWCEQVEGRAERFKSTYDELLAALD